MYLTKQLKTLRRYTVKYTDMRVGLHFIFQPNTWQLSEVTNSTLRLDLQRMIHVRILKCYNELDVLKHTLSENVSLILRSIGLYRA